MRLFFKVAGGFATILHYAIRGILPQLANSAGFKYMFRGWLK
jgi:hypothetical protein